MKILLSFAYPHVVSKLQSAL